MNELQEYVNEITNELDAQNHHKKNDICENLIKHEQNR